MKALYKYPLLFLILLHYAVFSQIGSTDSLHALGEYYYTHSEYIKSNEIFYRLLKDARENDDIEKYPLLHNRIGLNYWKLGDYKEALENLSIALQLDEELGNEENIAMDLNNTGLVHWSLKEYDLALESYKEAREKLLALDRTNPIGLGQIYNNMGIIYKDQGKLDLALDYAKKAFAIFLANNDKKSQGNSYNNQGIVYKLKNDLDSAEYCFKQSLIIRQNIDDKEGLAVSYNNIAEIELQRNKPQRALKNALKSLELSNAIQSKLRKTEALHTLSNVYEKIGKNDSALYYFKQYHQVLDSIFSKEKSNEIAYYQAKMETALKDLKIENLQKEKKLSRLRYYYITATVISIIAVFGFFIQRRLLNYRKDKKLADIKLQNAQEIIAIKENELKDYILTISRKNKVLKVLRKQNRKNGEVQDKDDLLKHKILTEQDWQEYQERFTAVYPGFFSSLKLSPIPLTESEIRMLALIKLNLTGKEMAAILGISPQSVRVSKARLKKKLGDHQQEDIDNFLKTLV